MAAASPAPRIARADFETSAADPSGWPAPAAPGEEEPLEVAFVGRSNVGKSSLLNALVERKGLARTSADPGRTRLVNFFRVDVLTADGARRPLRFVDLPGFGYAKVSKSERATWRPTIERYLGGRASLRAVVLLVDARRVPEGKEPPDEVESMIGEEKALLDWIAERGVSTIPVITKSDKLAKHERALVAERLRRLFGRPPVLVSALSLEGRDRLWARLLSALAPAAALTPSESSD